MRVTGGRRQSTTKRGVVALCAALSIGLSAGCAASREARQQQRHHHAVEQASALVRHASKDTARYIELWLDGRASGFLDVLAAYERDESAWMRGQIDSIGAVGEVNDDALIALLAGLPDRNAAIVPLVSTLEAFGPEGVTFLSASRAVHARAQDFARLRASGDSADARAAYGRWIDTYAQWVDASRAFASACRATPDRLFGAVVVGERSAPPHPVPPLD